MFLRYVINLGGPGRFEARFHPAPRLLMPLRDEKPSDFNPVPGFRWGPGRFEARIRPAPRLLMPLRDEKPQRFHPGPDEPDPGSVSGMM